MLRVLRQAAWHADPNLLLPHCTSSRLTMLRIAACCRGVFSGLPGMVTLLWALYNCIGPYLLLHYTYLGRQDSLRIAASVGMHAALALAVLAVALLVVFSPTSHDLAHVSPGHCISGCSQPGGMPARESWLPDGI